MRLLDERFCSYSNGSMLPKASVSPSPLRRPNLMQSQPPSLQTSLNKSHEGALSVLRDDVSSGSYRRSRSIPYRIVIDTTRKRLHASATMLQTICFNHCALMQCIKRDLSRHSRIYMHDVDRGALTTRKVAMIPMARRPSSAA